MIKYIQKKLSLLDEHTKEVLLKSSYSTLVKIAGIIIALGVSILLGRTIGAEGLGIINLSNRVVTILIVFGLIGIKQVIVKEIAIAYQNKNYKHIGNVMFTAYWLNGGITILISIFTILITPWLANTVFNEPKLTFPLIIALVVMTPQIISRILSSALIGYRKIWQSNLVEQTLSIALTGIILMLIRIFDKNITINLVAICYAIGRISVTLTISLYWKSLFGNNEKRQFVTRLLLKTSLPLFISSVSVSIINNLDVIILGALADTNDVGIYTVASRIAMLTSFFLQVTNSAVAPKIAALFENGKIAELEKMIQRVTRGLGYIGIIQLAVFIIAGKFILNLWGNEFANSYFILITLGFGQLINIGTGAVGIILTMCGFEKIQKNISLIFLIINFLLNIFFIYYLGVLGAAIALTLTTLGINLSKYIFVVKKLNIHTIKIFQ
jgi:O-antigen/teichoic acid export membrane protein